MRGMSGQTQKIKDMMCTSTIKYLFIPMRNSTSRLRNASILAATATLSLLATPAHAGLTLSGTSGAWSNPSGGTDIEYKTEGSENIILWGDPADSSSSSSSGGNGKKGNKKNNSWGYQNYSNSWTSSSSYSFGSSGKKGNKKNSSWGYQNSSSSWTSTPTSGGSTTAGKSGLGFEGIGALDLAVGEIFNLGKLTHYNKTIWSGTAADAADLKVDLDFGFGTQSFDFTMNIDETRNDAGYHAGGVCPYVTTTANGCSDSITWSNSISANTFKIGTDEYKLDLVGFSDSLDVSTIKNKFISQEGGSSHAHIFAQVTQLTPVVQDIPEPATLLGLGLFGFAAARFSRSKVEAEKA